MTSSQCLFCLRSREKRQILTLEKLNMALTLNSVSELLLINWHIVLLGWHFHIYTYVVEIHKKAALHYRHHTNSVTH